MACKHPTGVACRCNLKGDCLTRYQITSDAGLFEFKNGDAGMRTLKLVDKGEGTKVSIAIEGSCVKSLSTCPTGYLTDNIDYSEALSATQCKTHTLRYRGNLGHEMGLWGALQSILAEGATPLLYTRYKVCITQCAGKPQVNEPLWLAPSPISYLLGQLPSDTFIDVYPKTEIKSNLTLSFSPTDKTELTDKDRKEEYQYRKDNNLRGERTHVGPNGALGYEPIPKTEIKKKMTLSGSLAITQGALTTEYTNEKSVTKSNLYKPERLQDSFNNIVDQWKLINGIIDITQKILSGTYQKDGASQVKLIDGKWGDTKITLKGTQTRDIVDAAIATSGSIKLGFSPLCEFTITLDMILAAAAYFKAAQIVDELLKQAKALEEKVKAGGVGAYAGAEFVFALTTKLDATSTITFTPNQAASCSFDAVSAVTLLGKANIRGGAKVWFVEGAFLLEGEVVAEGKLALQSKLKNNLPHVELVYFHDGIKAKVKIEVAASVKGKDDEAATGNGGRGAWVSAASTSSHSAKKTYNEEWVWADPLTQENSPYRTTLIGG